MRGTKLTTRKKNSNARRLKCSEWNTLIASNSAPQAHLDAARADFQKAQEQLEAAKDREKSREMQMLIEKSRGFDGANLFAAENRDGACFRRRNFESFNCPRRAKSQNGTTVGNGFAELNQSVTNRKYDIIDD